MTLISSEDQPERDFYFQNTHAEAVLSALSEFRHSNFVIPPFTGIESCREVGRLAKAGKVKEALACFVTYLLLGGPELQAELVFSVAPALTALESEKTALQILRFGADCAEKSGSQRRFILLFGIWMLSKDVASPLWPARDLYDAFLFRTYGITDGEESRYWMAKDHSFQELLSSSSGRFPVPRALNRSHYSLQDNSWLTDHVYEVSISDGYAEYSRPSLGLISFQHCTVLLSTDLTICDSSDHQILMSASGESVSAMRRSDSEPVLGRSLFLRSARYSAGVWGHWLLDYLPWLIFLDSQKYSFDTIFIANMPEFAQQSIELLLPHLSGTLRSYKPGQEKVIDCEEVCISSDYELTAHPMNFMEPSLLRCFRRRIFSHVTIRPSNSPRIYLSRKFDRNRRVRNEDTVINVLKNFGFRVVYPARMDLSEQVSLFSQAECIVAPHGSALSGIAFCRRGTRVLELMPCGYATNAFAVMSSLLGLDYCQLAEEVSGAGHHFADLKATSLTPSPILFEKDYEIDVELLEDWLDLLQQDE